MHRKGLVIGILILLMGVNIGSTFAGDADVKTMSSISFDGNTLYVGGSGPNNYTKIQDAIDNSSHGDTVFVYDDSSPYNENVVVDKSISLIGEDKESTQIKTNDDHVSIISITVDSTTVQGFSISCSGQSSIGISITSNYNIVNDNKIEPGGFSNGIYSLNSSFNVISNNILLNQRRSIVVEGLSENNTISDNFISDNWIGILVTFFDGSGSGSGHIIRNNTVHLSSGYGIFLRLGERFIVEHNIISECDRGLCLDMMDGCEVSNNDIKNNVLGIRIDFSDDCIITKNNFLTNFKNIVFYTSSIGKPNHYINNYWGRPRILPKLIFGEYLRFEPYIVRFFFFRIDWHPAQEPYDIGV